MKFDLTYEHGCHIVTHTGVPIQERPTLAQLVHMDLHSGRELRILDNIASHWEKIGMCLQIDEATLRMITVNTRGDVMDCCREMMQRWLMGSGRQPVTWATLIEVLREAGLKTLAGDLEMALTDVGKS